MTSDKRSGIFLACGFLLILLGSIPLNGYAIFLLWPDEFHQVASLGLIMHLLLLIGLVMWSIGIALVVLGAKKARRVLMMGLVGIGGGCLMALPSLFKGGDHKAALGFVVTTALGMICAATARAAVNMWCRPHAS
jgi:hypothetical protein